jgi:sugar phosphate permease
VVSSPFSGWILGRWGWRVLLISEGVLPFLWLVIWWGMIDDHPAQARWISAQERDDLVNTLSRESAELETVPSTSFLHALLTYLRALLRPQVIVMVVIYFLLNSGNYGFLFWLPSALEGAHKMSNLMVGELFSIPFLVTAIGMVLFSRHSDWTRERKRHVAFALGWGGLFLLASVLANRPAPALSFVLISLVGAGSYGALGAFWAIPTETLPRSVAGSAMGLINALGNLGGYFGPLVVGYLNQRTGNFLYAFGVLSVGFLVGSGLALLLRLPAASPASVR